MRKAIIKARFRKCRYKVMKIRESARGKRSGINEWGSGTVAHDEMGLVRESKVWRKIKRVYVCTRASVPSR